MVQIEAQPRPSRGEQTRANLLSLATSLFADRGYRHTSTANITRGLGMSDPTLYRHFNSKEILAVEVVKHAWEVFRETLTVQLADKKDTTAQIEALLEAEKLVFKRPEGRVFYRLVGEADAGQALKKSLREFLQSKTDLYREIAGDDYIAFRISTLIGIGVLAIAEGPELFDAVIDQLKKEFCEQSTIPAKEGPTGA